MHVYVPLVTPMEGSQFEGRDPSCLTLTIEGSGEPRAMGYPALSARLGGTVYLYRWLFCDSMAQWENQCWRITGHQGGSDA